MSENKKHLAVIGGGIIGLSIAWRAAQRDFRVTLFEKGKLASEASWAGAGMLAPGGEIERDDGFSRLLIAARAIYPEFVRELEEESGQKIEFQQNGALDVAYSDAEVAELQQRTNIQAKLGIASKPLTAEKLKVFWPRVRVDGLLAARFVPGDAVVNPRDVTKALARACYLRGVEIREQSPVTTLNLENFNAAVIAAGAWSSEISVTGFPPLPAAKPVRGHLLGYRQPTETLTTIVRRNNRYFLQRESGLLVAGASMEDAGYDRGIDKNVAERLQQDAAEVIPHLAETTPEHVWTGLRPGADRLHIGPWHSPKLLLAYGHLRNGILLAPITADRILARLEP